MSLKGVIINKGVIGPNAAGPATSISGLIAGGVAVAGKLVLGTVYTLNSLKDTEALGLDADYDSTNSVIVYHHISEFYRMAGDGTKLYLMVVAQSVLPGALLTDANAQYAKKLVAAANGDIRTLAIAFNPEAEYEEVAVDGINGDITAAIPNAQAFAQWAYDSDRPLQVILEGRAYSGDAAGAGDLRAIDAGAGEILQGTKVSVVIGQDFDFAATMAGLQQKYAAVGTALGTLASIDMNQNIGEVETLDLSDAVHSKFLHAGLSDHTTIEDDEADLDTLDTKGYIFPIRYAGISGYRWNGDHVCAPQIVDADGVMNESSISLGRTSDESVRALRLALLPKVKTVQPVDQETGKLPRGVVKYFEGLGDDVFATFQAAGFISAGKTYVDPDSDLLTGDKSLDVAFVVVPTGTVNQINGNINLKTSL